MSGIIKNDLGELVISENAIAMIAGKAATENYGLVGMINKATSQDVFNFIKFATKDSKKRGVKVTDIGSNTFDIDLYVKLMYGLSMGVVAENIVSHVRYQVQRITGMIIRDVNIHIEDVWVEDVEI